MLTNVYDPLKGQKLEILDAQGNLVKPELEPKIAKDVLLKMYKTMILSRQADLAALKYQRQGRMGNYLLNSGQEASQVGAVAALEPQDWVSPYYRDAGIYLYRGVSLEQFYLYWYGNENGSKIDPKLRILPANIIIGSSVNLGAGLAFASKYQNKKEVTIATIGDGGTAHEEFNAGLNYAAVFRVPLVVLIQNNQYSISNPRAKVSQAPTLAQKCYAFGIPGMQVDGNDVLAVYVAVKEAITRAREGQGPILIENIAYRLEAHSTNDNASVYRSKKEEDEWRKKDPIIRFQAYLIKKGFLSLEQAAQIEKDAQEEIVASHQKVEQTGTQMPLREIFEHTYEKMTPQLEEQFEECQAFLQTKEGK
ncbi:pyruvate dehydrogenase (acetyl-transferring) E1 component subunit alpha [Candidatus Phytoplasma solani]|uniref:Pyruvate dehydrogenase E1 component subunit alpha n=1 Tax=Candidatus Phytoplasma solani TaxID=69896 RepID=A0A421NYU9_9MOLU|nr:pyruvate dehydrogenase (acetyl-transferring) E1 component subunit alpha [Candidatus Phytoplasma solani]RMI89193.1 pyruvate dehydrogenase E1 component subunit alpha [Candidatus Phytoplasma solani]RMI89211.1 pyruvate dehydrogenase E1 component subunit alpha [Candidatus Phytoplasma solani]CCP87985.1 Pyruvate dehydrogenase E1 component subunit alpha (PdhA) [Candidatus Phytoplasma solani]